MTGSSGFSVVISATDRASRTIDQVNRHIAGMRAPVERVSKSLSKFGDVTGLTSLGKGMRGVAQHSLSAFENVTRLAGPLGAITGAASIAGMARLAAEWANLGTSLGNTALRAGLPVQRLHELQGAAQLAGSSAEALSSGMTALNDNLTMAAAGRAPEAIQAFNYLGFSMRDAGGHLRTVSESMPELADRIAAIHDPAIQAKVATMLFGGAAEDLLPFLRKGSAGIAEYAEKARYYGVMNDQGVAAANRLREAQTELSLAVRGGGNAIAEALEPALTPLLHDMAEWIGQNHELIGQDVAAVVRAMADSVKVLASGLHPVIAAMESLGASSDRVLSVIKAIASVQLPAFLLGPAGVGLYVAQKIKEAVAGHTSGVAPGPLNNAVPGLSPSADTNDGGAAPQRQPYYQRDLPHRQHPRIATDRQPPPAAQPITGAASSALGDLIGRGEGGYNSVNRGAAGGYRAGTEDLAGKTVGEVMADQAAHQYNAAGKYQIIRDTLKGAARAMGLKGDEKFDQALQDRIFEQYLITQKRPEIAAYLNGGNNLHAAQLALSEEWASAADPDTGRSHYAGVGNNRASISVAEETAVLQAARAKRLAALGAPSPQLAAAPPSSSGLPQQPSSGFHLNLVSPAQAAEPGITQPSGPDAGGIGGGTGASPADTTIGGDVRVKVIGSGFPSGTKTSASASGNAFSAPPYVEMAMPL